MNDARERGGNEPRLGAVDVLDLIRSAPPPLRPLPRRRRWPWLLLAVAGVLMATAAALVQWREPLGRLLVPDPPLAQQMAAAEAALRRGELSRRDGQGARELFQTVLAVDPDHPGARRGLAAVREAALALAGSALDRGDRARAREALDLAVALSAPAARLQPLEARMRVLDSAERDLEQWLAEAQQRWQGGRDGEALAIYRQVLQSHPDNSLALAGRQRILGDWLEQAMQALALGDLARAEARVAEVLAQDPAHVGLPPVQARIGEARAARERDWRQQYDAARQLEREGRWQEAWQAYQRLLRAEGVAAEARAGLGRLQQTLAQQAQQHIGDGRWREAESALQQLRRWSPSFPHLDSLQAQLARARGAVSADPAAAPAATAPTTSRLPATLPVLLQAAAQAIDAGQLLQPPGASAWDRLRQIAAAAPDDPALARLWRRFERAARDCFERHALGNRLSEAESCLDARALREPPQALADARRRLALRWIALASERIGQNEPELAERALGNARRLDPSAPGLEEMERRLQQVLGRG